jgi:hypothetical protein
LNLKLTLTFVFSVFAFSIMAQPSIEFKKAISDYPGEHAVIISDKEHVTVDLIKNEIKIKQERYTETLYLDQLAGLFTEHSVDYSEFDQLKTIEAATLIPQKNKYSELKVKEFTHEEKISKSVFFDGGKSASFLYPKLEPGNKTYIKYSKEITEPRFLPSYYFQRGIPVKSSQFSITAHNDIEIGWKLFNSSDSSIQFSKTPEKNNRTTYTWTSSEIKKLERESNAPDARYYTPHIITWIKSYKSEGKRVSLLAETKNLYQWYYSLVKDSNKDDSPELQKIADSLKAQSKTELENVKNIYYWVQDHIRYIAFEEGMGGFIPRSAKSVCEKRYGDCKDMSSIIYKLLEYSGIKGYLTWIGSRDIPYNYSEVSTPSVDNHMICTYIQGDQYYFLDATGQYTPFGMPTEFIQGKEALISIDENTFQIRKVPIMEYKKNQIIDTSWISLENGKIKGKGVSRITGYDKISLTYSLVKNVKDQDKVLRNYCEKGNNKFLIDSYKIHHLNDKDQNLILDYEFNIDNYAKQTGNELYINMNLDKHNQNQSIKKDRVHPFDFEYGNKNTSTVILTIPKGYKINYIPENITLDYTDFGFSINYKKKNNSIEMIRTSYSNLLMLESSHFENWNAMIRELNKAYANVVVLKKQ